ncbi:MAG: 16S rRNA (cytidine(1402)-2'-O)-methyltransferase [Candidatus Sericytochromatia bacterium]|nr:16S rRNA (cytidine(1402)-2'-O)-methyltransferase [Candidatus Sericytochromatia bacterium]
MTPGTLYLCATPIGNLQDMTLRGLECLRHVDLILAEDTRQTRKLLIHYAIQTPLKSFHAHNEQQRAAEILERLQQGQTLALVSDAGLPLISDPGAGLVRQVQEAGLKVTCLPGASAPAMALLLSGLAPVPYCFLGFFPRQQKARRELLTAYLGRPETLVMFESPHRLAQTLELAAEVLGAREASVCRELSKRFEEVRRDRLPALAAYYAQSPPKGEITLVIAGSQPEESALPSLTQAELQAQKQALEAQGLNKKAVLLALQTQTGLSRNQIYAMLYGGPTADGLNA